MAEHEPPANIIIGPGHPGCLPVSFSYRRFSKWVGLVVCVVILAMWAVSTSYTVAHLSPNGVAGCLDGTLKVVLFDGGYRETHWIAERRRFDLGLHFPVVYGLRRDFIWIRVPFWLLFALAAIPTAILWHRDRRTVMPGCCLTCGYDLRASKKTCPECGTAIPARPRPGLSI